MRNFSWSIKHQLNNSNARTGTIVTPHGKIDTPAFIFCATKDEKEKITISVDNREFDAQYPHLIKQIPQFIMPIKGNS